MDRPIAYDKLAREDRFVRMRARRVGELKVEQEDRRGTFHDVPETLPSLLYARKVQKRAASTGFELPDLEIAVRRLGEELAELEVELRRIGAPPPETEPDARVADKLGDVLFLVVSLAQRVNVDPELALRQTARAFIARVDHAQELAAADGDA